ncbi:MAG: MBOAT family O-acyltransferase [Pseudomonadota bacterium]
MVFSSIDFLFLFLPAFLMCAAAAGRSANAILLGFSLVFYAAGEGVFVAVMVASICWNYLAGRLIDEAKGRKRRLWLALGIAGNLAMLGHFKYLTFLAQDVLGLSGAVAGIHLPLGISFFTFQAISYLVDLHRGQCALERSPLRLATYIAMFPQLVAGPIVRFASVAEALRSRMVTPTDITQGMLLFAGGLAAKVLIADTVAEAADALFGTDAEQLRADAAALAVVAYTLQIYFDFLGYSLMAVGLGRMLGFRFPRNFNHPYVSLSVTEFWRRWHISLSTWFRDYLYIPLGGNRLGPVRTYANLALVFLATGLWHGAAWTFVVWGMFHGLFLVIERAGLGAVLARLPILVRGAYTLGVVMAGWVLFRAENLEHATAIFGALTRLSAPMPAAAVLTTELALTLVCGVILVGPWVGRLLARQIALPSVEPLPAPHPRALALGLALFGTLFVLSAIKILAGSYSPFIYFRF